MSQQQPYTSEIKEDGSLESRMAKDRRISGTSRRLPDSAGSPSRTRGTHHRELDRIEHRHGAPSEKRPHHAHGSRNDRFGICEDHAGHDRSVVS